MFIQVEKYSILYQFLYVCFVIMGSYLLIKGLLVIEPILNDIWLLSEFSV